MHSRYYRMWRSSDIDVNTPLPKGLVRRILGFARPYRGRILLLMGGIIATSLLGIVGPVVVKYILDDAIRGRNLGLLNRLAALFLAASVASALVGVWVRLLTSKIAEGLIFDLRVTLFDHIQRLPIQFFTRTQTGALISRLSNDVVGAQRAVSETTTGALQVAVDVVITLVAMFSMEWRLTLLVLALFPLFAVPSRLVGKSLEKVVRQQMQTNASMNSSMTERFQVGGALLVKLFGKSAYENKRFSERAGKVRDLGIKTTLYSRIFSVSFSLVTALGTVLVFWVGGRMVIQGAGIGAGTIVSFSLLLAKLYGPLRGLTDIPVDIKTALVSFDRVFEVLDFPNAIAERPGAVDLPVRKAERDAAGLPVRGASREAADFPPRRAEVDHDASDLPAGTAERAASDLPGGRAEQETSHLPARKAEHDPAYLPTGGAERDGAEVPKVEFDKVWFRYPPGSEASIPSLEEGGVEAKPDPDAWTLQDVSFSIPAGTMTALVGPSGGGKTTISMLVPRLYDATKGSVRIDGFDVKDLTIQSLADAVGMVTQDAHMFHDTIRANLAYAKPDVTEQELVEATKAAQIYELISSLPDRFDTMVGERGYRLSGGEKQRLAIARLLLKDPSIVILDEATAHLDSESELLIQQALSVALSGRSSLVIAHRLSTIINADQILAVDHGRIVERGRHYELLKAGGLYEELYRTQFERAAAQDLATPALGADT